MMSTMTDDDQQHQVGDCQSFQQQQQRKSSSQLSDLGVPIPSASLNSLGNFAAATAAPIKRETQFQLSSSCSASSSSSAPSSSDSHSASSPVPEASSTAIDFNYSTSAASALLAPPSSSSRSTDIASSIVSTDNDSAPDSGRTFIVEEKQPSLLPVQVCQGSDRFVVCSACLPHCLYVLLV